MAEPSIFGALRDPQFRSDTLRNLVEALNGAKRSLTVGSLGAAGDMGNTLANLVRAGAGTAYHEATGRPIPQALEYRDPARDFGTSASLGNFAEQQGWLPPQTYSMPEQAGALLGPIVAMKAPDLAQSTLRGLVSALKSEPSRRMIEGYVDALGARPKATVWHGSPHQFDAFDSSKIGTGEGAQAYGHGLYTASEKSVAASPETNYMKNERIIARNNGSLSLLQDRISDGIDQGKSVNDIFGEMTKLGLKVDKGGFDTPYDALAHEYAKVQAMNTGHLYKVDLPDPLIARMLDWDKPLSQQAPEVQTALQQASEIRRKQTGGAFGPLDMSQRGRDIVPSIGEGRLRQVGIPGIRYLDGGSRADGAGTSNFVVFPGEESALTILERNGKPVRNNATTSSEGLPMSKIDLSRIPGAAEADNAVREIERLAEQHGTVYIRWSAGTGHDLKPGANSRDSVSGSSHAGLSAIPISGDMHPVDIAKRLAEYGFLRMKDKGIRPRVYVGEQIGTDSDGYALIRPSSEVAKVSDETVRAIDSGYAKAAELRDRIDELSARLPKLQGSGRDITERNLAKARGELDQLLSSIKK